MTLEKILRKTIVYRPEDVLYRSLDPVFKNASIADIPSIRSSRESAVEYAMRHGGVLQSLYEAIAFQESALHNFRKEDLSAEEKLWFEHVLGSHYLFTRTALLYFREPILFSDGHTLLIWKHAYVDTPDPEQNIILARAGECDRAYKKDSKWELPKTDAHVKVMLDRARASNRISPIPSGSFFLFLIDQQRTEHGHECCPIFDPERHRKESRRIDLLTQDDLNKLDIGEDNVVIQACVVGNEYYPSKCKEPFARKQFIDDGVAAGTIYNVSKSHRLLQ